MTDPHRIAPIPLVTVRAVRLNPACWPPCDRCKLDVNRCECDPSDETRDHRAGWEG